MSSSTDSGIWGDRNEASSDVLGFYFSKFSLDLEPDPTTCVDHTLYPSEIVTLTDLTATYTPIVRNEIISSDDHTSTFYSVTPVSEGLVSPSIWPITNMQMTHAGNSSQCITSPPEIKDFNIVPSAEPIEVLIEIEQC